MSHTRQWSLEAADVVRAKCVEGADARRGDDIFNEVKRPLSPDEFRRSSQVWRRADVSKHRRGSVRARCTGASKVRGDVVELRD